MTRTNHPSPSPTAGTSSRLTRGAKPKLNYYESRFERNPDWLFSPVTGPCRMFVRLNHFRIMEGVSFRRDHRLFYRDSNLHTQYISPDPELYYDKYDMGYLVVPHYRFMEFCKWHEKQGTEADDLFYKFETKFGDPSTIHVYPNLDFHG